MNRILGMLFHAKKLILISFFAIFAVLLLILASKPDKYEAHMSFLVRNARAQSLVSADPTQNGLQPEDLTEERINSEVELLGSAGLLQAVVIDQGLEKEFLNAKGNNRAAAVEQATRKLSKNLDIFAVRMSDVIKVTYTSSNRDQSKNVLDSLSRKFLREDARLHSARGAAAFYNEKLNAVETTLQGAQNSRAKLLEQNGYMLLPGGQQLALDQLVNLQKAHDEILSSLAETNSRLRQVRALEVTNAPRVLTQQRISTNPYSLEQLATKLVELQNQRTELRAKFLDNDPLLIEKDKEIAETQAALDSAQAISSKDTTSDVNPLRQSLDSNANQLNETKAGLMSRLEEVDRQIAQEKSQLDTIERVSIQTDSLNHDITVLQDSADLYRSRYLSASAAEEMDPQQFSNVVEATHPTVPVLPAPSHFNVVTSFLLAALLSLGIGLASEWREWETYFRT